MIELAHFALFITNNNNKVLNCFNKLHIIDANKNDFKDKMLFSVSQKAHF